MNLPAASTTSVKGIAVFIGAVLVANFILSQIEATRKVAGLNVGALGEG